MTAADRAAAGRPYPPLMLWFAALGGPVSWTLHLVAESVLVPVSCDLRSDLPLHLVTLLTALVAAAAVVASLRLRGRGDPSVVRRVTFLAHLTLIVNVVSLAAILQEAAATFFLSPCE